MQAEISAGQGRLCGAVRVDGPRGLLWLWIAIGLSLPFPLSSFALDLCEVLPTVIRIFDGKLGESLRLDHS